MILFNIILDSRIKIQLILYNYYINNIIKKEILKKENSQK